MSERLADDFVSGDSSSAARRGDASVHSGEGSTGGASTGSSNQLREFRDEFLAQRKRYHIARAKAMLLTHKGFAATPKA